MRRVSCLVIFHGLTERGRLVLFYCNGSSVTVFRIIDSGILKAFEIVELATLQAAAPAIRF